MSVVPRPPSSLLGRDDEVAQVAALLLGGARLVTLAGLGGAGKTRVALAVGARLLDAGRAVAYCDAASLHGVDELAGAVAAALRLELRGPGEVRAALGTALASLPGPRVLIIDPVEHLAEVAADALVGWLARAPGLQLLLTSRVALGRPEELVVPVLPLPSDSPASAAVDLLVARARAGPASPWQTDRAALQRLARHLHGMPLALELAAARAHLVSPEALAALLEARDSGAKIVPTLVAAVAWSWDQLAESARVALARLAVLEGSFDLELAATLAAGARGEALDVLDTLSRHCLLSSEETPGGARYRVLDTVREYALGQIAPETATATRDALAEALLARVEPHLSPFSRELPAAVTARVKADGDLYLGVIRRALTDKSLPVLIRALRVAIALVPLFQRAGFGRTATEWTLALLSRDDIERVPLPIRVGAAMVVVVAAGTEADTGAADALVARIAAWLGQGGDARIYAAVAILHYHRWDHRTLLKLSEPLLRSPLAAENPEMYGYACAAHASARRALGLASLAEDDARLAEALSRLGPNNVTTACLLVLTRAFLLIHIGDAARGLALAEDGLERARAAGNGFFTALFHLERGRAYHDLGRLADAQVELGVALGLFHAASALRSRQEALLDWAFVALERGRYDEAARALSEAGAQLGTTFERAWHMALTAAFAALNGVEPELPPEIPLTDSVEDGACLALAAIGRPAATGAEGHSSAAHSFRARRARGLLRATAAIGTGEVLALALDGSAFRVGAAWVDVSKKPLLRTLLAVLSAARADHAGEGVSRDTLGRELWADERLPPDSRDQRLQTAVSALRRLGAEIEAHGTGYRLVPPVVRVSPAAWPGEGGLQRSRGRGRPRREP